MHRRLKLKSRKSLTEWNPRARMSCGWNINCDSQSNPFSTWQKQPTYTPVQVCQSHPPSQLWITVLIQFHSTANSKIDRYSDEYAIEWCYINTWIPYAYTYVPCNTAFTCYSRTIQYHIIFIYSFSQSEVNIKYSATRKSCILVSIV